MKIILSLAGILFLAIPATLAYTAANCPSMVPEWNRIDCHPEPGSTESSCAARGCMWCEASVEGPPWCFYDDDATPPGGECTSCNSCSNKLDCYPEAGSSEGGCYDRGCLWCPSNINGEPWCITPSDGVSTTPPTGGSTTSPAVTNTPPSGGSCSIQRLDCFPEAGSSESGCYSRGCLWCPSQVANEPWCIVPEGGTLPPSTGGECPSDIPVENRIDCWPGGGATQAGCEDAGCIWCESSAAWCFFNTTNLPEGIPDEDRVNCIPEGGFSPATCEERGCVFASANSPDAPMCYFHGDGYGYRMREEPTVTYNGYLVTLDRIQGSTLFGNDVDTLTLQVTFDTESRLHIKFFDPANDRFEVPLEIHGADPSPPADPLYDITFVNDPVFSFKVTRKLTGAVLLDTSLGGFTFSDQFLQFPTKVPSTTILGFGEHEHQTINHSFDWSGWGMWSRDQPPDPKANLYGVHPFYIMVEEDNNAHGVFFLNSAAQDITLTPAPGLVYRTIGGILDIYVFLGPEPNSVVEQYSTAVGRTFMPPYWSLGFQLCRYGYGSLAKVQETVSRMDAYDIPLDVQYGDIDYMDEQRDFTYDLETYAGLPEYVKELQAGGKHYVIILDPCITKDDPPGTYPAYDIGEQMKVWVMKSDGVTPLAGKVWPPGECVFPDYTNPDSEPWWTEQCKDFHDIINFDGLWIDMNEPANFGYGSVEGCEENNLNNPPYAPNIWGTLPDKSVCPDAKHTIGSHYDVHSLYGWSQANVTMISAVATTGKRPFVVSRSTFPGSGQWAAHWLGDNNSDWHDLRMSIIGMLEFNLFGIPYIGADICGFNGNVDEELCARWMELGAFYPYARNHNGIGYSEQDPAVFGPDFAQRSKDVLLIRYTLLPYLYTLFHKAHVTGRGVVLPLSFEFIHDKTTHSIDQQFLWGPGLLFSPVLYQGESTVNAYFPDARWYDYHNGVEVGARGKSLSISAPLGTIPIHIRGGTVIPTQEPAKNTVASRKNPFGLIVALDDQMTSSGELYWDEGDSLTPLESGAYALFKFTAQNNELTTTTEGSASIMSGMVMGKIQIMGLEFAPISVRVNGVSKQFSYSSGVATIDSANVIMDSFFRIDW